MSIFLKVARPLLEKAVTRFTKPLEHKAPQMIKNATKEIAPKETGLFQKTADTFEKHGMPENELKYINDNPELTEKIELLADGKLAEGLRKRKNVIKDDILANITKENQKAYTKLLNDPNITDEQFSYIAHLITNENVLVLKQLLKDKDFDIKILKQLSPQHLNKDNVKVLKYIVKKGNVDNQEMLYILNSVNKSNSKTALKLLEKSDGNTKGLNEIIKSVQKTEGMSAEQLKTVELREKFLTELIENPKFKTGASEIENYNISKVIENVKPENYEFAKSELLKGSVNSSLGRFLKSVTKENQPVAKRILNIAPKDTKLPVLKNDAKNISKYLDEVEKIKKPEARKLYLEAMEDIKPDKFDEALHIIKTSKVEDARHASSLISSLSKGVKKADAQMVIKAVENSGRKLSNNEIGNLARTASESTSARNFLERILKNKNIADHSLNSMTVKYVKSAEKLGTKNKMAERLSSVIEKLSQNRNLTSTQIEEILSKITNDNISLIEKYALSPEIGKLDIKALNPRNVRVMRYLAKQGIPSWMQNDFMKLVRSNPLGAGKRLSVLKELLNRNRYASSDELLSIVSKIDTTTIKYIDDIMERKNLSLKDMSFVLDSIKNGEPEKVMKLVNNYSLDSKYFSKLLSEKTLYEWYEKNPELVKNCLEAKLDSFAPASLKDGNNITPIVKIVGEKRLNNIIEGINSAKTKYGISSRNQLKLASAGNSNSLFITLENSSENLIYKFDKKTGNLVSVTKDGRNIKVAKETSAKNTFMAET